MSNLNYEAELVLQKKGAQLFTTYARILNMQNTRKEKVKTSTIFFTISFYEKEISYCQVKYFHLTFSCT